MAFEEKVKLWEVLESRSGLFICSDAQKVALLRDLHQDAPASKFYQLDRLELNGETASWLAAAIARNTHIELLDLRHCKLSDAETAAIIAACAGHLELRTLLSVEA